MIITALTLASMHVGCTSIDYDEDKHLSVIFSYRIELTYHVTRHYARQPSDPETHKGAMQLVEP